MFVQRTVAQEVEERRLFSGSILSGFSGGVVQELSCSLVLLSTYGHLNRVSTSYESGPGGGGIDQRAVLEGWGNRNELDGYGTMEDYILM